MNRLASLPSVSSRIATHKWFALGAIVFLGLMTLAIRIAPNEYLFFAAFTVLQLIVLATAWNVLGGYCGYINFGSGAFLAAGAYTSVALAKWLGAPLILQIVGGAFVAGTLGFIVGVLTLRLHGIFFAIATVAVAVILETAILNWSFVGGARGITVFRPLEAPFFGTYTRLLVFTMAVLVVIAIATARWIQLSSFGRGLRAIRDSEQAAECSGVPTLRLKLAAATISGALMGAAGAPLPAFMNYIEPTSAFSLNYAVSALAMPLIGGTSHWLGPIIGALILGTMQQVVTVTVSSEVNVLVVGLLLIGTVVAAPNGILGLFSRKGRPAA